MNDDGFLRENPILPILTLKGGIGMRVKIRSKSEREKSESRAKEKREKKMKRAKRKRNSFFNPDFDGQDREERAINPVAPNKVKKKLKPKKKKSVEPGPKGGQRKSSGRPIGTGKYGVETTPYRVPVYILDDVKAYIQRKLDKDGIKPK
jgi:hypothetical protein